MSLPLTACQNEIYSVIQSIKDGSYIDAYQIFVCLAKDYPEAHARIVAEHGSALGLNCQKAYTGAVYIAHVMRKLSERRDIERADLFSTYLSAEINRAQTAKFSIDKTVICRYVECGFEAPESIG